jgi:catechol 2,3-dioxygenase-like lactoylglutathione lyase family enzyme
MINHVSFGVPHLERAAAFYDAVLLALGYVRVWTAPDAVGYGLQDGSDEFAVKVRADGGAATRAGFHVAFTAPSRASVEQFHATALRHGAVDNGGPALRTDYGPYYYAAFVIDPDGHPIEAVFNDRVSPLLQD